MDFFHLEMMLPPPFGPLGLPPDPMQPMGPEHGPLSEFSWTWYFHATFSKSSCLGWNRWC
jgi:hypothetical protein